MKKRSFLLDTNMVSFLMRGDGPTAEQVSRTPLSRLGMSVATELEVEFGIEKAGRPARLVDQFAEVIRGVPVRALPTDIAKHYAQVRCDLEKRGSVIGHFDLIIAAHAVAEGAVLVTNNTTEFKRVKGLRLDDWSK